MGKTLIAGGDWSGWFAGTWTRVVGIGFGVVGIPLGVVARGLGVLPGEAIQLAMSSLAAVGAFLLGFGFGSVIVGPGLILLAFVLVAVAHVEVLLHVGVNGADDRILIRHVVFVLDGENSGLRIALTASQRPGFISEDSLSLQSVLGDVCHAIGFFLHDLRLDVWRQ